MPLAGTIQTLRIYFSGILVSIENLVVREAINISLSIEARNGCKDAPTSIYLGGGPGHSSFDAMSGFPCTFNPDGNSTSHNEWSWNNHANMLYIDQPIGSGFSYVTALNGSLDLLTSVFTPVQDESELPELNATTLATTMDAEVVITNTTASAARTLWQFAQIWFQEFPEWDTTTDEISLWGVSVRSPPLFPRHALTLCSTAVSGALLLSRTS